MKVNGAEPDEFEAQVAQELLNLEVRFLNVLFHDHTATSLTSGFYGDM